MPAEAKAAWVPLRREDLPAVLSLAAEAHPSLPERPEVFAEKLSLFPAGCLKLEAGGSMAGYGFSHPWAAGCVPKLDDYIGCLPPQPGCLYIHDVAVARCARGGGAAGRYVELMLRLAAELRLPVLALTAVYGTGALWSRFGFGAAGAQPAAALAAYGAGAAYMTLRVSAKT